MSLIRGRFEYSVLPHCCCVFLLLFSFVILSLPEDAFAFKLPDTGQTKCYQGGDPYAEIPCAGTGQDGEYSINPMSYTDNGNGTVTDYRSYVAERGRRHHLQLVSSQRNV